LVVNALHLLLEEHSLGRLLIDEDGL